MTGGSARKTIIALAWAVLAARASAGQFTDSLDGKLDFSSFLADNAYGFLPVPIIITEPALGGFGLGMVGLVFHEDEAARTKRMEAARTSDNAARFLLPPSVSAVAAAYTINDSWLVGGGHFGFWKEDHIRYRVAAGYGSINMDFYGTSDFEFKRPLELETEGLIFYQRLSFRIADSKFLVGLQQSYARLQVSPNNLRGFIGDYLPPGLPPGLGDGLADALTSVIEADDQLSGIGVVAEFDNRDNLFSPRKGYNYRFEYLWQGGDIGSDYDYSRFTLVGLNYWPVGDRVLTGLRLQADWLETDDFLPLYVLPYVNLRGIPAMRYQGDYVALGEFELTWLLNMRWSVLGFGGVGRTASAPSELGSSPNYFSRGVGFRYLIARRYGMTMGVDVARGPEDSAFYISAGSSW